MGDLFINRNNGTEQQWVKKWVGKRKTQHPLLEKRYILCVEGLGKGWPSWGEHTIGMASRYLYPSARCGEKRAWLVFGAPEPEGKHLGCSACCKRKDPLYNKCPWIMREGNFLTGHTGGEMARYACIKDSVKKHGKA